MKKLTVLFIVIFALISYQNVYAQKSSGLYVETTKFAKYLPADPKARSTEYRYDKLNRVTLIFGNVNDSMVVATIIDYDSNGNRVEQSTLPFIIDKKNKDRYLLYGEVEAKKFAEIIQKILDRLDVK